MGVAPWTQMQGTALDSGQEQGPGRGSGSSGCIPVLRIADMAAVPRTVTFPLGNAGAGAGLPGGEPGGNAAVAYQARVRVILAAEWDAMPEADRPANAIRSEDGACYVVLTIEDASLAIGD